MTKTKITVENLIYIIGSSMWISMSLGYIQEDYILILGILTIWLVNSIELSKDELQYHVSIKNTTELYERYNGFMFRYIRAFLVIFIIGLLITGNLYATWTYIIYMILVLIIVGYKLKKFDIEM